MNLKNKKVLITGATGGIGNSLIDKFYNLGANTIATGTNEEKLNNLKKNYSKLNIEKFQLNDHQEIEKFIEKIDKQVDGLDILVNNAGIALDNLSIRLSEENWKKVIDINLTSTFLMCKFMIKKMLKRKYGKIINITSIKKKKKNININCVSPGFIKTDMTDKINEEFKNTLISKIPSGKLGTGEDVSNCVAFLASDMANYINGETIHVNGGMYMA